MASFPQQQENQMSDIPEKKYLKEREFRSIVNRRRLTATQFNQEHPPGTPCMLILDDRSIVETKTRGVAWDLGVPLLRGSGGNRAVVCVEGRSGGYDLNRIVIPSRSADNPALL